MKKLVLLSLIMFSCVPEMEFNRRTINYEGEEILIGQITAQALQEDPFSEWYQYFYDDYKVDTSQIDLIADALNEVQILVFLGTWCSDSQWQIPGFVKVLLSANYDFGQLTLVGLERGEDGLMFSPDGEEANLDITHVPTYLFYKEGEEIGRIVENPMQSLEKDMFLILEGK